LERPADRPLHDSSLLSAGRWRTAATACSAWLKRFGSDPGMHAMYAEALRGLEEYEAAENHARRAIAAAPGEAGLHYALLMVLWEKRDWRALKAELPAAQRLGCDQDAILRFSALLASKTDSDDKAVVALVQDAIRKTGPAPNSCSPSPPDI
jgi:Flp pilus assembly protein TadD